MIKLTRLTPHNIDAIRQCYPESSNGRQMIVLDHTTCKFWGDKEVILQSLEQAFERAEKMHGRNAHPYASLHAVRKKILLS